MARPRVEKASKVKKFLIKPTDLKSQSWISSSDFVYYGRALQLDELRNFKPVDFSEKSQLLEPLGK